MRKGLFRSTSVFNPPRKSHYPVMPNGKPYSPSTGGNRPTRIVGIFDFVRKAPPLLFAAGALFGAAALARPAGISASAPRTMLETTPYSIALIDILPNRSNAGAWLLRRQARELGSVTGCLRVELIRQAPPLANHFALLTMWRDVASRDHYLEGPGSRAFRTRLQPLAASPIDDRLYGKVAP